MKNSRKSSKRKDGKRLNAEARESPLEVFQLRQEYYSNLARDEIAKGEEGCREHIDEYLLKAQQAGEALAPYRHARLSPSETPEGAKTKYLIRAPAPMTPSEWDQAYCSPEAKLNEIERVEELKRKLFDAEPQGTG